MVTPVEFLPLRYRTRLRAQINAHFDLAEFQSLCYDLSVPYDDLTGLSKTNKVEDLIGRFERLGESNGRVTTGSARRNRRSDVGFAQQWQPRRRRIADDRGRTVSAGPATRTRRG